MAKGKDFYGTDIAEVIDQACRELGLSREQLDLDVLETGSSGIFGLCKKKAHIRVRKKESAATDDPVNPVTSTREKNKNTGRKKGGAKKTPPASEITSIAAIAQSGLVEQTFTSEMPPMPLETASALEQKVLPEQNEENAVAAPSAEGRAAIEADLLHLLELMGLPATVELSFEEGTLLCTIKGPHEEQIAGPEGKTLDNVQYLLRKMVAKHLPDKVMLALDAAQFRQRRIEALQQLATNLAVQVKQDGKTQVIPSLNAAERKVVHVALQGEKNVRSRSVGDGLFKKILIYKPTKGRKSTNAKIGGERGDTTNRN